MRKRRSAKQIDRDFRHVFADRIAPPSPPPQQQPWLTMTDEEIDQAYWHLGKADRTRMKRAAETERLRQIARAALAKEEDITNGDPQ